MAKTIQQTAIAQLTAIGWRIEKTTPRYVVMSKRDGGGNWYLGSHGSIRYGQNRTECHEASNYFKKLIARASVQNEELF